MVFCSLLVSIVYGPECKNIAAACLRPFDFGFPSKDSQKDFNRGPGCEWICLTVSPGDPAFAPGGFPELASKAECFHRRPVGCHAGCQNQWDPMDPILAGIGEFTTHFRTYFSGDWNWDVGGTEFWILTGHVFLGPAAPTVPPQPRLLERPERGGTGTLSREQEGPVPLLGPNGAMVESTRGTFEGTNS